MECVDQGHIAVPRRSGGHALTEATAVTEKQRMRPLNVGCAVDKDPTKVVQGVSVDGRRAFEMVNSFRWRPVCGPVGEPSGELCKGVANVLGLQCQQRQGRHLFPHGPEAKDGQEPSHGVSRCFPCCVGRPVLCRVLLGLVGNEFVNHVVHTFPFLFVALVAEFRWISGNPVDNVGGCVGEGVGWGSCGGNRLNG